MEKTEQIDFWRGEFGEAYMQRNQADDFHLPNAMIFWSKIVQLCRQNGHAPESILEVGPNIGINLRILKSLLSATLWGIEPNPKAVKTLVSEGILDESNAFEGAGKSIPLREGSVDFVFTNGVLIHIHPDELEATCREIHRVSSRYIFCSEYFSVRPESLPYRGHENKLFKRDFGGLYRELFADLRLIDYGFEWKPVTGLDNMTWWLFEKPKS